jgi:hypothetical protein
MNIQKYQEEFLDYFNNYFTVAKFAGHRGISIDEGLHIINEGRELHELYVSTEKMRLNIVKNEQHEL